MGNRVGLPRYRAVAGRPVCDDFHGAWFLFGRADVRVDILSSAADDAAAFGEAILGVDCLEVLIDHELRAHVGRAFLARFGEKDHVAIERGVRALQHQHQHQARDQVVLVVYRTASVDVPAGDVGAEWTVIDPLFRIDRHHIGVPHHQDRFLLAVPFDPGDQVRAARIRSKHLKRNALPLEHLLHVIDGAAFIAGRVAGVDLNERLEMLQRFGFDRLPIDRRLGMPRRGGQDHQHRSEKQSPSHSPLFRYSGLFRSSRSTSCCVQCSRITLST